MKFNNGYSYFEPVLDANNAYADGDQVGTGVSTVTGAVHNRDGLCFIESIILTDALKVHGKFNILFFSASPTVTSSNNGALAISAAEMKAKFIGHAAILDTDWVDLNVGSYATKTAVALPLYNPARTGAEVSLSLPVYAIVQAKGAVTWTSAGDLRIAFSSIRA